ncbi:MAG: ribosomal protein S6 modification protein [Gammaproteobacteria bacterium RIFCSPHIGHO2_12_FULL_41_15]|nr:MAG: ribosomal protein S6 modification protein [Gammaproteobacteria bacterium RIFCSPHIGHO2_12_FULL_41_15]
MTDPSISQHFRGQIIVGWREWLAIPALGIDRIKAKVDTGARTSTLHAFALKSYRDNGKTRLRFKIHPLQRNELTLVVCEADVFDKRWVTDSGGHYELRYVIKTPIVLGNQTWPIEITLTNRDTMGFRMLLGRTAMRRRLIVDPGQSYLTE